MLVAAAVLALALVLGGGAPRPEVARAADAAVVDAADQTLASIERLQAELSVALDAGRVGAARVVAGGEDPRAPLTAAGEGVIEATPTADELRVAFAAVERARAARDPGADRMPPPPDVAELESIAAQLDDAAKAGATFAQARRLAEDVSAGLADALDAAAAGELGAAREQLALGLIAVDAMRSWEDNAPVLSVWIDIADAMIRAMQRLVDAVEANDAEEVEASRAEFEAAAQDATDADRALRIGLDEAGSAVTAVPLGRLSNSLGALAELEEAVRAVRAEVGG